jgi:hypothetical protein
MVRRSVHALPAAFGLYLLLQATAIAEPKNGLSPNGPVLNVPQVTQLLPKYSLNVLVVRTCNDDGSHCTTATQAETQSSLDSTNTIHQRSGSGIKFVLDPQNDFTATVNNTLLNTDCIVPSGVVPENITDPKEDKDKVCDTTQPALQRTAYALLFPHSLVVFARGQAQGAAFDKAAGHWTIAVPTGGYSGCDSNFVVMRKNFAGSDPTSFAHESGHYLCSPHTFSHAPTTVADAATIIRDYVEKNKIDRNNATLVLRVFDADWNVPIHDTPPDPGDGLFAKVNGNKCDPNKPTVSVPVTFSDHKTKTYVLKPARDNIMSYFKGCPPPAFKQHFTPDQVKRHIATITGMKHVLIDDPSSGSCYQSKGLAQTQAGMSVNDLIKYRANIIAECTRAIRHPLPGEIFMENINENPADLVQRTMQSIRHEHPGEL